jgi:uncharacterized membrane protein
MKTCPACQQASALNVRACPFCGHKFISPLVWVVVVALVFVVMAGVLLMQTRSR